MSSDFQQIDKLIKQFSEVRDWNQFHTPKNLLNALVSEMGELSEIFLWKTDSELEKYLHSDEGKQRISEEIADLAIYLIRLCQKVDLNFLEILESKMKINDAKYPVEKSKGNSKKYSEFEK